MIAIIVLIIVGIVVIVASRHYVQEPVLRTLGVCVGAACVVIGVIWGLVALLDATGTPEVDTRSNGVTAALIG